MALDARVKKYAGDNAGLTSVSMLDALTQGVDYTLSIVRSVAPQTLPLFGRKVSITSALYSGYVSGISIASAGSGYSGSSTLVFSGGGGTGAEAWMTLSSANGNVITAVGLGTSNAYATSRTGSGYTSVPTVTVANGGSGSGATFLVTAVIKDGMDLGELNIFDVLKVERNGYIAEPSSADNRYKVSDTKSIYRALSVSPVYITDFEGILRVYPDLTDSENGTIYCISSGAGKTIDITASDETIKDDDLIFGTTTSVGEENFPSVWKELVVLHASELLLIERLGLFRLKLPTDLDTDTTLFDALADIDLTPHGVTFPLAEVNDALTKAQNLIDGTSMGDDSTTAESAQYWLLDEDEDMVGATLSVAAQELGRANSILGRFTTELSSSTSDLGLKEKEFQINLQKKMALYDKIIGKLTTDYQWVTQQLQLLASKKQEFIQSSKSASMGENPAEKSI
jgi:hypothetical protein